MTTFFQQLANSSGSPVAGVNPSYWSAAPTSPPTSATRAAGSAAADLQLAQQMGAAGSGSMLEDYAGATRPAMARGATLGAAT